MVGYQKWLYIAILSGLKHLEISSLKARRFLALPSILSLGLGLSLSLSAPVVLAQSNDEVMSDSKGSAPSQSDQLLNREQARQYMPRIDQ